jgi:hypothetical protein
MPRPGATADRHSAGHYVSVPGALRGPVVTYCIAPSVSRRNSGHADGTISYHFWQPGGGHDRNLRSDADVREKIAYVHHNPVRRRLVEHPRDWPWSSWRAWHEGADKPLRMDRETMPPLA